MGSEVPLLMGYCECWLTFLVTGLLASFDSDAGKGVGGGSEEQLYCPFCMLNPALHIVLITDALLISLFACGLDSGSSPLTIHSNEQELPEKSDLPLPFILKAIFSNCSFCLCYI